MEGLEATIISQSEVMQNNSVLRVDSTYFLRDDLKQISEMSSRNTQKISDLAYVTDGIHTSIDFDEGSGIKVISAKHPKDGFFDLTTCEEISLASHSKNPRTALRARDIIISTVGTIGNVAVVTDDVLPANSDRHVGIVRPSLEARNPISPEYLTVFLLSTFGRMQSRRETTGNVQPNLFLVKIRDFDVARIGAVAEAGVAKLFQNSQQLRLKSIDMITESENALLAALGLADWKPPEPLSYVASSADAFAAGRLDAQYFHPKFAEVQARLKSVGGDLLLSDALSLNSRGRQPQYSESGLRVVNSKHVRTNRVILDDENRFGIEAGSPVIIQQGDVLLNGTGVGTIGRAAPYVHNVRALPDNHVTVLRPHTIDPIYLSVFLNSQLGQLQIERFISGSSGQIELYPSDIAKIVVWDAPKKVQLDIRDAILSAFDQERDARELLDRAKRAVEIAIEDNEAAALRFLEEAGAAKPQSERS